MSNRPYWQGLSIAHPLPYQGMKMLCMFLKYSVLYNVIPSHKSANESRGGGSANRFSFRAWRSHIYT